MVTADFSPVLQSFKKTPWPLIHTTSAGHHNCVRIATGHSGRIEVDDQVGECEGIQGGTNPGQRTVSAKY
jgi:hypothetical protein